MIKATQVVDGEIVYVDGRRVVLEGRDAVAQRIKHSLSLFLGEFSLEPLEGVDWFRYTEKGISLQMLRQALLRKITEDPAVIRVSKFEISRNDAARSISVSFTASTTEGEILAEEELL